MNHLLAALVAFLCLASPQAMAKTKFAVPPTIAFDAPSLYPEGVAYNADTKEFLVGSLHDGNIGSVSLDGKYRLWAKDARLVSTFGMKIDKPRNRLLVCVADLGVGTKTIPATRQKLAAVVSFDLDTGRVLAWYNLGSLPPGDHFANDLAVDDSGNIFVTDSLASLIYEIDASGRAFIAFTDPQFVPNRGKDAPGLGLNGIAAHPDGYLLVVKMDSGTLFKVDLKTHAISQVALPKPLPGGDGLLLEGGDDLLVVQNEAGYVVKLHSADDWKSAKITGTTKVPLVFPTTMTMAEGKAYVLEARLPELFDPKAAKSSAFAIHAVNLKP
ncbi:MAG: hypothetical protein WDO70_03150 [Alphaproteobacteria bacterium]